MDYNDKLINQELKLNDTSLDVTTLHKLAITKFHQKKIQEAIELIKRAITINETNHNLHHDLGNIYFFEHKYTDAIISYKNALTYNKFSYKSMLGIGNCLYEEGKYHEAIRRYYSCINHDPTNVYVYNNLGNCYKKLENYENAIECLTNAVRYSFDPEKTIIILENIVSLYWQLGNYEKSSKFLEEILALDNQHQDSQVKLYLASLELFDFHKANSLYEIIIKYKPLVSSVFNALYINNNNQMNMETAILFAKKLINNNKIISKRFSHENRVRNDKIKIGYLSNDWFNHPTWHLLKDCLVSHNHTEFEVYVYSYTNPSISTTIRYELTKQGINFVDIYSLSHLEAADKIFQDNIDILIDLKLYTNNARPEICLQKPAPININYLGMCGTSGSDVYDYILADKTVIPPEHQHFYTEKVKYLPGCFQPRKNLETKTITLKEDYDLPYDKFIFASFNQLKKIDVSTINAYIEILEKSDNAILWLGMTTKTSRQNLKKYIPEHLYKKIIFAPIHTNSGHLKRLIHCDLILDPFIYNGHTTSNDALFKGVPVLTKIGNTFVSRVSASLLYALNVPQLICKTKNDYIEKAIYYSNNRDKLKTIKEKIQTSSTIFFNANRYTYYLEQTLLDIAKENSLINQGS